MSEENVEVVRRIHQALADQDTELLLAVTDRAITCYDRPSHPDATVFHGHRGLLQMLAEDMDAFDEIRYEAREFVEVGNYVLVRIHQRALGKKSHIPVEGDLVMLWTVRRGKGVELHIHSNEREALRAAGLSE